MGHTDYSRRSKTYPSVLCVCNTSPIHRYVGICYPFSRGLELSRPVPDSSFLYSLQLAVPCNEVPTVASD